MTGSLDIRVALDRPIAPADAPLNEPLHALVDIIPEPDPSGSGRPPLNLVLVVDASATMHNFQLTDEQRDMWMTLAVSRDEMERGEADERRVIYWSGQTLADMQATVRKPMSLAVEAIQNLLSALLPTDKVAVIAFADRAHTVFGASDWATVPDKCRAQLELLNEQRLPVDIGNGSFMAEALRLAGEEIRVNATPNAINRLIIISDGIVQDADATLMIVASVQEQGYAITTLGVGDEFDEEFLTRVADNSRGEYHYAPTSEEITGRLTEELSSLQTVSVTDLHIAVRGEGDTVIQDLALVRPTISLFDEIYTEDGWTRARVGDVSSTAPAGVLIQFATGPKPAGRQALAEIQLTWAVPGAASGAHQGIGKMIIEAEFSHDPTRTGRTDAEVTDLMARFTIYKNEREAQRAQERGDLDQAREKLGTATRQLRAIGEDQLAEEMESQIASLGVGSSDAARGKRIKATTRRLGNTSPKSESGSAAP